MRKKPKTKVCKHDFAQEQCDCCGHFAEFCLKCEKGRCTRTGRKLQKLY